MNSFEMKISPKVSSGGARSSWKRLPKLPGLRPTDCDGSEKLGGGSIEFGAGEAGSTLRHCAAETPAAPPQSESAPCLLHHIISISLTKGCAHYVTSTGTYELLHVFCVSLVVAQSCETILT